MRTLRCLAALAATLAPVPLPAPVVAVDFEAEFADGRREALAPADLSGLLEEGFEPVLLRVAGAVEPELDEQERATLQLLGGDRLAGRIGGGEGERLLLELPGAGVLGLSIDGIAEVVFEGRIPDDPGLPVVPAPEGDRLFRLVGERLDRVDGAIEAFSAEGVQFDGLVGSQLYPWEELAALFIEPLVEPGPPPSGARAVAVDLADGSRVRGLMTGLGEEALALDVGGGQSALRLPWTVVRAVSSSDGRLEWLGEREPSLAVPAAPFGDDLGMVWPHRIDRSVTGGVLAAGGRTWARGIGAHSPSRLEWELDGSDALLRGAIAVDDSTRRLAARGSVRFMVELDGEVVFDSGVVRGGDQPREIPAIRLEGASKLALVVDPADAGHVADRANWLELRLVR